MSISYETTPIHPDDHADQLAQAVDWVARKHELSDGVVIMEGSGVPEFDKLHDYEPKFEGQVLLHRSNAELQPGDIVLPSDQISPEMHEELNRSRGFISTSSPRGAIGYDKKLAHAGTRDYGDSYGKYLYVVEPLEGDTLKWGENFGAGHSGVMNYKDQKVTVPAFRGDRLMSTDSYTGKAANEVVSVRGFRVVDRIEHEPLYEEAMLPWPVGPDARVKHAEREELAHSVLAHDDGRLIEAPLEVRSRKKPGKLGVVTQPGTYRAGADRRLVRDQQARFDLRKQRAQHAGQLALAGMPIARFRKELTSKDMEQPIPHTVRHESDDMLPGFEAVEQHIPQV